MEVIDYYATKSCVLYWIIIIYMFLNYLSCYNENVQVSFKFCLRW